MREIITIQLGSTSNFVGTHFWNSLESKISNSDESNQLNDKVDFGVFYRTGMTVKGEETYNPRLILLDLKGGLHSLKATNPIYEKEESINDIESNANKFWSGKIETYQSDVNEKSQFVKQLDDPNFNFKENIYAKNSKTLNLNEDTVKTWSDFNMLYYHPKTIIELSEFNVNDDTKKFGSYSCGEELYKDGFYDERIIDDNLRYFLEDCDQLQGFQIFCDINSGFSGFTAKLMEDINDELGKNTILTYGLDNKEENNILSRINKSLCMKNYNESSILYVPMEITINENKKLWSKYYTSDFSRLYHSSSIFSSVIESVSLPLSSTKNFISINDMCSLLNTSSIHLGGLSYLYPSKMKPELELINLYSSNQTKKIREIYGQQFISQGIEESQETEFERQFQCMKTQSWSNHKNYSVNPTFPQIFNSSNISNIKSTKLNINNNFDKESVVDIVTEVPMLTRLSCDSSLHKIIDNSYSYIKAYTNIIERETSLEIDQIQEIKEGLKYLADTLYDDEEEEE